MLSFQALHLGNLDGRTEIGFYACFDDARPQPKVFREGSVGLVD